MERAVELNLRWGEDYVILLKDSKGYEAEHNGERFRGWADVLKKYPNEYKIVFRLLEKGEL